MLKASSALLQHINSEAIRKEASSTTKTLLGSDDDVSNGGVNLQTEPIWLVFTTKKHIVDEKRLKPGKIPIPHSLHKAASSTVCLITADPQRSFKDTIGNPAFPSTLRSQITRVIGISKVLARYKSFESRRQFHSEHDVFLADSRIITRLPKILGKIFYGGTKRPVPVNLQPLKQKSLPGKDLAPTMGVIDSKVAPPAQFAKEIDTALSCAVVNLSPSVTTSIRVGSSHFQPHQLADNIEAVVNGMVPKLIPKGWKNVKSLHIKGPMTMALPVWLADELWQDPADVIEDDEAERSAALASQKGRKRKGKLTSNAETEKSEVEKSKQQTKRIGDSDLGKEMAERRAKLREQKKEAKDKVNQDMTGKKRSRKPEAVDGKVKIKTKKLKRTETSA